MAPVIEKACQRQYRQIETKINRYVKSLMDARANIKIVVFDRKPVSYQERYMRQQIIGHLKQQNCGLQIFGKWDDQEWKIFCERERVKHSHFQHQ